MKGNGVHVPAPARVYGRETGSKNILVIAGPTATGKTRIAVEVAQKIGGEIISADSMQVYRGMDIGTAKVTKDETCGVPHHLIDIKDIREPFNVVDYVEAASLVIEDIHRRGKVPIVCGGTGFYIHSLLYGAPQGPPSSAPIRDKLTKDIEEHGPEPFYHKLVEMDPEYAKTIGLRDKHKIVRALEIIALTGKPVSEIGKKQSDNLKGYAFRCFFLHYPREITYQRIEYRCKQMIQMGFLEEVERLEKNGLRENLSARESIGYKQYLAYLDSDHSDEAYDEFVASFKQASRRYAKRQFTWFRKEKEFEWLNLDELGEEKVVGILLSSLK